MQYRFEALDDENARLDFWARSWEEAATRLKEYNSERQYVIFRYGSAPKNLTFNLVKKIQEKFKDWQWWMRVLDEYMGELLDEE